MTHAPRREELLDLALGLLEPEQARALEAHAAGCPACRDELAALRRTRTLVGGLPPLEAPEAGVAPLLAAARQAAASSSRPRWAAPRWLWGGTLGLAGAAAVAVLVLGIRPTATRRADSPEEPVAAAPRSAPAVAAPPPAAAPAPAPAPAMVPASAPTSAPAPVERAVAAAPAVAKARKAEVAGAPAAEARQAQEQAFVPKPLAEEAAPRASARRLQAAAAPAPAPAPAPAATMAAPPAAVGRAAATKAGAGATADAAEAERPPCRLEQQRRLDRDLAGRVIGRVRQGRYPLNGGEVPLLVEERFGADGQLRGGTVVAGDRRLTVSAADVEAGRLEPLPGVVLARTAAEAAAAPPRCEP